MACVEFRHVDMTYADGTRAVADLDLEVADGEMMVLVGPSGSGKSTVLRLLAGLETASRGEILIDGERVNEKTPQRRDIALVFQNYALYPHMTVRGNLDFPLRMRKLPVAERNRRVEETARLLDLSELLQRYPRQLSGGQRQRVAMGRALVRQPRVFLMDEPLSNLDARLRTGIRAEIASLQKRLGITTIYVTHDQVEAMTLGDRIAVLDGGRLQQSGKPQQIYDRPLNAFVATFLGNPGMNIFEARADREAGAMELAGGCWRIPLQPLLERIPGLAEYRQDLLLAGLRPEAFSQNSRPFAKVTVKAIESLGHERLVYFQPGPASAGSDSEPLVARLAGPQAERPGQVTEIGFEPSQLYFYSKDGDLIV